MARRPIMEILEIYGADRARWPASERSRLEDPADEDAAETARVAALDELLRRGSQLAPSPQLERALWQAAFPPATEHRRWWVRLLAPWFIGVSMAGATASGAFVATVISVEIEARHYEALALRMMVNGTLSTPPPVLSTVES